MRFEHVNSYAATPAEVLAMLTTPEFRERVCEFQRALEHSVEISGSGVGATVVIRQTQSMEGAPAVATKVVGSTVRTVQRESWRSLDSADFEMEIPGKPGHLRGTIRLLDKGDGSCEEHFSGEVKVSIPLVGGKLEGLVENILKRGLRREGQVGATWLAERQG